MEGTETNKVLKNASEVDKILLGTTENGSIPSVVDPEKIQMYKKVVYELWKNTVNC